MILDGYAGDRTGLASEEGSRTVAGGIHTTERPFLGVSEKTGAAGLDPLVR